MHKKIALSIISFSNSIVGQKLIFKVKNDHPWIWERCFSGIRRKLSKYAYSITNKRNANQATIVSSLNEFKLMFLEKEEENFFKRFRGIQIFTPDFNVGTHTITELAFAQSEWLQNTVKTKIIRAPYVVNKSDLNVTNLHFNDNPKESNGVSIFHLGNNTQSTLVLHELFLSKGSQSIVILHDFDLLALFQSYANFRNMPNLLWELVEEKYGSFGVINLGKIFDGKDLPIEIRARIYAVFIEIISRFAESIIHHNANVSMIEALSSEARSKLKYVNLPLRYVRNFVEDKSETKLGDPSRLIIISGHLSHKRKIDLILKSLVICLERGLKFRIRGIGSINTEIKNNIQINPEFAKLQEVMDFYDGEKTSDWLDLHERDALGIRLNVGSNGESSGLVRDYLMFKMKVISDDQSANLQGHPRFYAVSTDCDAESLAHLIHTAFNDEGSSSHEEFESCDKTAYVNLLTDTFKEMFVNTW